MSSEHQQQEEGVRCTICLEKAADVLLPLPKSSVDGCQHTFCLRCIRKWAKSKNTCPLCREEFLQIRSLKRKYAVVPPPPPPPRRRIATQINHQRRIYYIPIIVNQPLCYYYSPNASILMNNTIDLSAFQHHFAVPSFFIPN
jgi:hypothetical protein